MKYWKVIIGIFICLFVVCILVASRIRQTDGLSESKIVTAEENTCTSKFGVILPSYIGKTFADIEWVDTLCVCHGKTYCLAFDAYSRTILLYNENKILANDPALNVERISEKYDTKFYISVPGRLLNVDLEDLESTECIKGLGFMPEGFTRFSKDYWSNMLDRPQETLYSMTVDYPDKRYSERAALRSWLVEKIGKSIAETEEMPEYADMYIGHAKRNPTECKYNGNINDCDSIGQFAADCYFSKVRAEFVEEDFPPTLYRIYDMRISETNERFVTYRQYTHEHWGGAHGFYTERLLSYDVVHEEEIDFDYLFRKGTENRIKELLFKIALKDPLFRLRENINSMEDVKFRFLGGEMEDGKLRFAQTVEEFKLPQPGLSDTGIVFSFQPYEIGSFASGAFHFTIPYNEAKPYLTQKAEWCCYSFFQ